MTKIKLMTWWTGLALAGVLAGGGSAAVAAGRAPGSTWGRVISVPGLSGLIKGNGGGAQVLSMSCASAGNCAAGGYYWDRGQEAFVAVERHGRWGKATPVPGLAALNAGRFAFVFAMSCPPSGDCTAGGEYAEDDGQDVVAFTTVEKNGKWSKAVTMFSDEDGSVDSLYCVSAGDCLAGGTQAPDYFDSFRGYLAQERNGRWGKQTALPGLFKLSKGGGADVLAVWCASPGNCSAGGYTDGPDGSPPTRAFVVSQHNGKWGRPIRVPGLEALNKGLISQVSSMSCVSAGRCVAGGYYSEKNERTQAFIATERNGHWATATSVPGLAALDKGGQATSVNSVWCSRGGSCTVGGFYTDSSRHRQGFVATERNGRWGQPIPLPGLAALNTRGSAEVNSVWCGPAGRCASSGSYAGSSGRPRGFVTQTG